MGVWDPLPALGALSTWLHVGACVLLPLAWGLATEYVFRRLAKRREGRECPPDSHFFIDYNI